MKNLVKSISALSMALLFCFCSLGFGQSEHGRQSGKVTDVNGNPLEGVMVNAGSARTMTDASGNFVFKVLPAGIYIFTFSKDGYQMMKQQKEVAPIMSNRPLKIVMSKSESEKSEQVEQFNPQAVFAEAQKMLNDGKYQAALDQFKILGEKYPQEPVFSVYAGLSCYFLRDYKNALVYLEPMLALEQFKNERNVIIYVADSYFYNEAWEKALGAYDKVIEIGAADKGVYLNRGIALANLNRFAESIPEFQKARELDPTMFDAAFRLGLVYEQAGMLNEAVDSLNKAKEINPEKIIYIKLGEIYEKLENYLEAYQTFEKYLEVAPKGDFAAQASAGASKNLLAYGTKLLMIEKNKEDAVKIFQRILELYPASEEADSAKHLLEEAKGQ